ncbi:hypothetical protein OHB49_08200 [Streptomyces sp. NBC_01717]
MPKVPTFAELLADCRRSAVHLEMRDVYGVANEDADFQAWQAGHRYELDDRASWWNDFHQTVADGVARGISVRRVRVVSEPVSDYIRFEHSCTPQNLTAGEDIRWLPRRLTSELLLPGNDYWLFDDRAVKFGLFTGEGAILGHQMSYATSVVKQCADAFDTAWDRAVPHADYRV